MIRPGACTRTSVEHVRCRDCQAGASLWRSIDRETDVNGRGLLGCRRLREVRVIRSVVRVEVCIVVAIAHTSAAIGMREYNI